MQSIGKPFTELIRVDSSNNYAMAQAQKGAAKHGETWFAHEQTAGKGSRGKSWKANPGENIMMSVLLLPFNLLYPQSFYLTAAVALSAYDLFSRYAVDEVRIKWPNDIYWRDRKAAGILIENSLRGPEWQWSIAGIGMNINQTRFDPALPNPVSLKQITGATHNPVALARELCQCLELRFSQLQNDREKILTDYNTVVYKRNEVVQFKKGNIVFSGTVRQADASGDLLIDGAMQPAFAFGELEWILPKHDIV